MSLFKKGKNIFPEKDKKLSYWQGKYEDAKSKYATELNAIKTFDNYYDGMREVKGNPNETDGYARKVALNVRNIVYELIESQVDTSIPMPKVRAIHEEDEGLALKIEQFLQNEILTNRFKEMNDMQERVVPTEGGDFFLVEWDNTKGYHCNIGDLSVSTQNPYLVIPQPGVTEVEKMDYIFTRTPQTKEYIKRRFNKDVSKAEETDTDIREGIATEDIVTLVTAYYKNEQGGIGIFRWCDDVVLEDLEDYQARIVEVCEKCGRPKGNSDVCECGSKKFKKEEDKSQKVKVYRDITTINVVTGEQENTQTEEEVEVPYYKPNGFPLILRKNISRKNHLLGYSDVAAISDQQDTIKKLGSKINEKLLKGGSYVTLPSGVGVELTDEEFKVIRIENPAQKALIDVVTVQAECTQDRIVCEENYGWAKSTLGITDSFQGKYDSSALSGTAKQYSINQAAGRLESKRVMKNSAYAKLYETMFKFALAYADEPIPLVATGTDGEKIYSHFNKDDFLKQDSAGEFYWNDEFIFETDPTSTLLVNREAMWNQADMKLQSGAFGQLGDLETNYLYWLEQERNSYPHAGEIKEIIEQRLNEQKQMMAQQQMAQQMPPQEMPSEPSEADLMAMLGE